MAPRGQLNGQFADRLKSSHSDILFLKSVIKRLKLCLVIKSDLVNADRQFRSDN